MVPSSELHTGEKTNIYTQKDYNNQDQATIRWPREDTLSWHPVTETDSRESTLSLGTLIGDLQVSLELPKISWDVPQGGSRFLLTCLSVTLFHLGKGVRCMYTSMYNCKPRMVNQTELTHKDRDKDTDKDRILPPSRVSENWGRPQILVEKPPNVRPQKLGLL